MNGSIWQRMWRTLVEFHPVLLDGLRATLTIGILAFIFGLVFGTILAIIRTNPSNGPIARVLKWIVAIYVLVIRGLPLLVQLLIWFWILLLPLGFEAITIAVVAFTFDAAAYMSESLRGSIEGIDKGQMEAGRALGMSSYQTYIRVVLPQSFKNAVPQLGNELISIVKGTSLVGFITVMDLRFAIEMIIVRNFDVMAGYLLMAIFYLVIVYALTLIIRFFEKVVFRHGQ